MADQLLRETSPPVGVLPSPVPQAWDPAANAYRRITGKDLGGGRFGMDVLGWGQTQSGLLVPIRVNSSGQPEVVLSGSLPAGSNVIGKVQIDGVSGTAGGALPVMEARISAFRPRTVDATAGTTRLDTDPLPNRRYVDIALVGAGTGYIGNSDLTGASNGIPVTESEGYRLYAGDNVPIYGTGGVFLIVEVA